MRTRSRTFIAFLALTISIGFYVFALVIAFLMFYLPTLWLIYGAVRFGYLIAFFYLGGGIIIWSIMPRRQKFIAPGLLVDLNKNPKLQEEIGNLSGKAGQPIPDQVFVDFQMNASVSSYTFMWFCSKKILILGLPMIQYLSLDEFRGILAHEIGHFFSGDTKLTPFILNTRASIIRTLNNLERHSSKLQIPFKIYAQLFIKVTNSISREQEYSADQFAVSLTSKDAYISTLNKIHSAEQTFSQYWQTEVVPLLNAGYRPNITEGYYHYIDNTMAFIEDNLLRISECQTGRYDSHPSLSDRIQAIKDIPDEKIFSNEISAASLFDDIEDMELKALSFFLGERYQTDLEPIRWDETVDKIYIPSWKAFVSQHYDLIKDFRIEETENFAKGLHPKFRYITQKLELSYEEAVAFSSFLFGAALSILLIKRGFRITAEIGQPICFVGEVKLEPFTVINKLNQGKLSNAQWQQICQLYGLAGECFDMVIHSQE